MLEQAKRTPHVEKSISEFHADIVQTVKSAVAKDPVVVIGMSQNPVVKKARAALREAGIEFTYLEYGSYFSEWKKRLAIKLWSGWPTFPQVFVRGVLIGGNEELRAALADGTFKTRLNPSAS